MPGTAPGHGKRLDKKWNSLTPHVITFDLPGHGNDNTDISRVTFDSYVEKVKQEITKLNTSVILVGHSLAGYIVSKVAEDMPNSIEKLVFVSAMIPNNQKTVFDTLKGGCRK